MEFTCHNPDRQHVTNSIVWRDGQEEGNQKQQMDRLESTALHADHGTFTVVTFGRSKSLTGWSVTFEVITMILSLDRVCEQRTKL